MTRDRTGHGTSGKRRQTSNPLHNGKPDGQMGESGEQRATNSERETEMSGGRRVAKPENGTDGAETSSS